MRIVFAQAQLVYEVRLSGPEFDIATSPVRTVQTLHDVFAEGFKVTPADLYVSNAVRLSEWATQLHLFNANWLVEYRFDRYQATCNRLFSDADMQLAVECVRRTEQAARALFTSSDTQVTVGRLSAWYRCDGGVAAAKSYLSRFAPANIGIAAGFEGAQEALFNIACSLSTAEERWSTRLLIEPSSVDYGHLFIQIEGRYEKGGKYGTLDEKIAHFTRLSQAVLKQADLEPAT
jgi:hypothetical protein